MQTPKIIKFIIINYKYFPSIFRSLYYNLLLLPLSQAIKIPIFISNYTTIKSGGKLHKGQITLSSPVRSGMIKLGYSQCDFFRAAHNKSTLYINGGGSSIKFNGYATIGAGFHISVDNNSILTIGNHFWSTGPILMIVRKQIEFEENCVLSWNITIMDHDAHNIYKNNIIQNAPKAIFFKKHCWIGFNSKILKGATIPENSVIAANSIITKGTFPDNSIIGGIPGKLIKENIEWE